MARWLHVLQQFQFSIIHRPGRDHGNADGLSRAPSSPCRQCTRPDCPPVVLLPNIVDQPFDSESTDSSEDADLIPIHSGEDWVAQVDDDFSQTAAISGDSFRISNLQREDPVCIMLHSWISSGDFPHGLRLKHWTQNFGHYGIIVTSYRWMITELFGENRVHSALCYNYWYLNLAGNNSSCLTMPLCLAAIWAGTGRWPDWLIVSIGQACRMMSRNGWASTSLA